MAAFPVEWETVWKPIDEEGCRAVGSREWQNYTEQLHPDPPISCQSHPCHMAVAFLSPSAVRGKLNTAVTLVFFTDELRPNNSDLVTCSSVIITIQKLTWPTINTPTILIQRLEMRYLHWTEKNPTK